MKASLREYAVSIKLFTKNARLYLFGSFLIGINHSVFQVLLNLYLKEQGFPEGEIGLIASAGAVGMTLMAVPAAILLSRVRLKPILITAVLAGATFSSLVISSHILSLILLFSFCNGMAFTYFRVAAGPFYMRNSSPRERTHLFSFSFGSYILSGMVGSLGAGRLSTVLEASAGSLVQAYQYTLFTGIGISLLSLIPILLIVAHSPSGEENRIIISKEQIRKRGSFYIKICFANFFVGMGAGLVIPFLNLYFQDRFSVSVQSIGIFFFLVQCAMLIGTMSGPLLAKRFGLVRTVVFTQLASIPFMLTLSYSYVLPLAVFAFIMRGGLMNLGVPIVTNLGMELSDKKEQGLVNALLMVAWTSAWMISSAIGGHLIELYGYTFTMNITIGFYVVSSIAFYQFFHNTEVREVGSHGWKLVREEVVV